MIDPFTVAAVGAIVGAVLKVLIDCAPKLEKYLKKKGLDTKLLQELEEYLLRVEKVLGDAEEKQITNNSVQKWLDNLKDVAYDAEDILLAILSDEERRSQQNACPTRDQIKVLKTVIDNLKLRVQRIDVLGLKEGPGWKSFPPLPTTSLVDESEVCLRNDCKENLVDFLLSADVNRRMDIPVIAITGMGGIGKTTLAQFLYNDDRVKSYFNLRAWASISAEFDVFRVTKTIYESGGLLHSDIEDLNILQVMLERKLGGRKLLLVVDNVWNVSSKEWDLLRRPLQRAVPGSKIIVTTRSQDVSSTMHSVLVHDLKPLSEEACLSLFEKHAFGGEERNSILKAIGKNIVKKCNGLPLAVKTFGSLLRSERGEKEWNNILNGKIWDLPHHKSDILPALRLSYHYLPSHLKQCFAYCSILPNGRKFEKRNLVRLWIAAGLVQQPNSRTRMEEAGEQYYDELVSRSIFQQSSDPNGSSFIMHDLVKDLAQYVAGEFYFKSEDDSLPRNPERVRHFSFIARPENLQDEFLTFYGRSKGLRTFLPLLSNDGRRSTLSHEAEGFIQKSSYLRVLSLSSYHITQSHIASIRNLKQLRYLDLSGARITSLDGKRTERRGCLEGVCSLSNLETLKLSHCVLLTELPTEVGNLTKLEHLDISRTPILSLPDSIRNLQQLGYLDLSGTQISVLCEGVCSLHNLQTLKLSFCLRLTRLPINIRNLPNLKNLDTRGTRLPSDSNIVA